MAQSSTRRRGRRATNRNIASRSNDYVSMEVPRSVATAFNDIRQAAGRLFAALLTGAAAAPLRTAETITSALPTVTPSLPRRARGRPRSVSTPTIGTPTAPTQRRARRAHSRTRSSSTSIDLANLGRGNSLADQVYRNLPAIGATMTLENLGRGCTLPNGNRPRAQDIGAVANRLQKAGIVRRGTGRNRNEVTTLRREALAA